MGEGQGCNRDKAGKGMGQGQGQTRTGMLWPEVQSPGPHSLPKILWQLPCPALAWEKEKGAPGFSRKKQIMGKLLSKPLEYSPESFQ